MSSWVLHIDKEGHAGTTVHLTVPEKWTKDEVRSLQKEVDRLRIEYRSQSVRTCVPRNAPRGILRLLRRAGFLYFHSSWRDQALVDWWVKGKDV